MEQITDGSSGAGDLLIAFGGSVDTRRGRNDHKLFRFVIIKCYIVMLPLRFEASAVFLLDFHRGFKCCRLRILFPLTLVSACMLNFCTITFSSPYFYVAVQLFLMLFPQLLCVHMLVCAAASTLAS